MVILYDFSSARLILTRNAYVWGDLTPICVAFGCISTSLNLQLLVLVTKLLNSLWRGEMFRGLVRWA